MRNVTIRLWLHHIIRYIYLIYPTTMNQFRAKLKLIFIPFCYIAILTIGIYTFLNWALIIKFSTIRLKDDVVDFFIPFGLPWIPLLIWIRPRIKLLKLKIKGRNDPVFGLLMLTWATMVVPMIIAQSYMETATGKLTALDSMTQVSKLPPTRYYTVNKFYVSKRLVHVHAAFAVSGKYNNDFNMTIYAAVPIFNGLYPDTNMIARIRDNNKNAMVVLNGQVSSMRVLKKLPADSVRSVNYLNPSLVMPKYGDSGRYGALLVLTRGYKLKNGWKLPVHKIFPAAWLAVKYQKTISNRLSADEKRESYREFAKQSQANFDQADLAVFKYLDRVPLSADLDGYNNAIKAKDDTEGEPVILSAVNEPFEQRNGNKLAWIFGSFVIGAGIFLIILQFISIRETLDVKRMSRRSKNTTWAGVKNVLWPHAGFAATPIIIQINLLVFIAMACSGLGFLSFTSGDLLTWGGNFRPLILQGQYWRLITNMFLHGGLMHLLLNMYGLMFVGIFLEPLLGLKKYTTIYLVTGVLASLASIWWHPANVSIGASGAIFGMYGTFLALLTTNLFPAQFKKPFLLSTSIFVVYNLLFGLTGGIDNAAHIGGLLSGILAGYILYPSLKGRAHKIEEEETLQDVKAEDDV